LAPILKQYKSILKITTRDASLQTQYKIETNTILRELERWVTEARVAADIAVGGFRWDVDMTAEHADQHIRERWALDRLCEALLEKGALVPVSKKYVWEPTTPVLQLTVLFRKRVFPVESFFPPKCSILIWTPLLAHLQSHHPDLPFVLADHIITHLLSDAPESARDQSFELCLARWAFWIIEAWSFDDAELDLKKDVTATFVTALGPSMKDLSSDRKSYVIYYLHLSHSHRVNAEHSRSYKPSASVIKIWMPR
jgi:ribosomal biogenesis protein LAS1